MRKRTQVVAVEEPADAVVEPVIDLSADDEIDPDVGKTFGGSRLGAEELKKSYRGRMVVKGVSLGLSQGEIVGLLGPNGAGKTTALRILSTVLQPTDGSAVVNGFDVLTQPSQVRRQIGFMSANTGTYDRMTAWELIEFFGRLNGLTDDVLRPRMEKLFEQLKMNDIRDVLGAKMSTGMRQKVSIARALVHDPPVLIFDEATSGLDVLVARSLVQSVAELREQGKCVVFSTHIMREAEKLCNRLAVIHRGRILAEGTLDELREQHAENDLEELFFRLISDHEAQRRNDDDEATSNDDHRIAAENRR